MKHDLDVLNIDYDADWINPDVNPEIADAFKAAFGLEDWTTVDRAHRKGVVLLRLIT